MPTPIGAPIKKTPSSSGRLRAFAILYLVKGPVNTMDTRAKETEYRTPSTGVTAGFISWLTRTSGALSTYGAYLAGAMLFAMTVLTFVDVASTQIGKLTSGLLKPVIGGQELDALMMGILVAFGLAYTAKHKAHIRVDALLMYAPDRLKRWFDILAYSVSCVFYLIIAWQGSLNAWSNFDSRSASPVLLIPLYPFQLALVVGALITALIFFKDLLEAIREVSD